jgi:hypothetical protein
MLIARSPVEVVVDERERLEGAQGALPHEDDRGVEPAAVEGVGAGAEHRHALLDAGRVGLVALALVPRLAALVHAELAGGVRLVAAVAAGVAHLAEVDDVVDRGGEVDGAGGALDAAMASSSDGAAAGRRWVRGLLMALVPSWARARERARVGVLRYVIRRPP